MGGRGASSGISRSSAGTAAGGLPTAAAATQQNTPQTLQGLINAMRSANGNSNSNAYSPDDFHLGEGSSVGDYTNNNDPNLLKWQQTTDETKIQKYLASLGKQQTPGQDAEGYAYHQSAFQNMVINQNLNAPVYAKLSKADFDKYCQQAGVTPIMRGWDGGPSSKARFENAAASHTGTGMYGEGYYFGSASTASNYANGATTIAALSPNARVIGLEDVRSAIRQFSGKTQRAFEKSGRTASSFDDNLGEAQMAMKMGYNVIRTSWSYVVLTRDAVVIRK